MTITLGLVVGLIGAAVSLASFLMKSMLPLRLAALSANLIFILYGVIESNMIVLGLHAILLPINAKRAFEIHRLIQQIEAARSDTPLAEWLLPHMSKRLSKAGETLWRRGDAADEMLYVQSGTVRLVEYGETLGAGSLVGEIGLFSPDNRRTQSLECVTDCELHSLTSSGMHKLYFQNPKLGFHLMRLVVGRLIRDAEAARAANERASERAAGMIAAPVPGSPAPASPA